jgi:predicted nuclease with TOPRIM domain
LTYAQNRSEKAEQELMTALQKLEETQSYVFTLSTENEKIKQDLLPNAGEINHLKTKLSEVEGIIDGAELESKSLREKLAEAQAYIQTQD